LDIAPPNCTNNDKIPFITTGENSIGKRETVYNDNNIIVTDTAGEEDEASGTTTVLR